MARCANALRYQTAGGIAVGKSLYDQAQGEFYDSWESASHEFREETRRARLTEYIEHARRQVPWYQSRLESFDPRSTTPLQNVPVLTSNDLRELLPPVSRALIAQPHVAPDSGANPPSHTTVNVFQSGGTTGMPKTSLFSNEELNGLDLPNARGFYALGLKPEDRVANLFAVGGLYMTFIHIHRMLQQYGCMNFPFANVTPPDFVHSVSRLFRVNCFTGISSVVLNALRAISDQGAGDIRIDKVFYGGEHFYDADKEEIRRKFGTELIAAPGYGTVDTWYIGYQCLKIPTGVFHAHDDQTWIEIVDEETGKACAPGETGMMYATAFPRRLTPVVRYRVGDRAQWLSDPCPCGRTTPTFRLLGRGDDVLRVGYDSIDYESIQKLVCRIPELSGSVQIEKRRVEGKDQLVLRVETESSPSDYPRLGERLEHALLETRPSFRSFVEKGTVWPVRIELLAPGALPRNTRTGKLIRVIDSI